MPIAHGLARDVRGAAVPDGDGVTGSQAAASCVQWLARLGSRGDDASRKRWCGWLAGLGLQCAVGANAFERPSGIVRPAGRSAVCRYRATEGWNGAGMARRGWDSGGVRGGGGVDVRVARAGAGRSGAECPRVDASRLEQGPPAVRRCAPSPYAKTTHSLTHFPAAHPRGGHGGRRRRAGRAAERVGVDAAHAGGGHGLVRRARVGDGGGARGHAGRGGAGAARRRGVRRRHGAHSCYACVLSSRALEPLTRAPRAANQRLFVLCVEPG